MEAAPLIKAHDHAKAASDATHAANSTVAINEHTRAAGEFANAAKNTTSVEALRTLKLLEEHHRRLSEILKLPLESHASQSNSSSQNEAQASEEKDERVSVADPPLPTSKSDSEKNPQSMPKLPKPQQYPSRDLGASIANNLASARGIRSKYRSQPLSPSVSNAEAPGNMELASRRSGSGSRSKMQNMLEHADKPASPSGQITRQGSNEQRRSGSSSGSHKPQDVSLSQNDEGFSRFYSAFGSIINRISAPLAFAGLPLVQEDAEEQTPAPEPPVQKRNRQKPSHSPSAEPDLSRIYSKAALKAISRDGHSANDSFYVVPTSGHTVSYASILSFADKEKRRMEASFHGDLGSLAEDPDEEDFVDAKESQPPLSPGLKRRTGKTRSEKELSNVVEELYLENKSLKDMLDKLSKRLHAFESMSQNSGMRLAESMRLMRPGSPLPSAGKPGAGDEALRKRNQELEEKCLLYVKQMDELHKDYNKARANLVRYREKWEQLKAGAKARRAGGMQGNSESTDGGIASPSIG
ncbi:uncharacterized protein BCR38DRAFT_432136 [Pseudomassariella vexata]|uniref:Uncharacterized protein n=1 Tax=Pseudomassariella vexata TaxID=1141098 RepID=A0A1Y2E0Z8_9PEZI|nr:uncharacterized protein BCR38DRAFT_432136 [Pseudomassariella vexata]ORY65210.1 hypothetical protein BCR38DRAFT_432136 [Pseudomassariella vexata]